MRIVTGSICHETSTFTPVATTWKSYHNERFGYLHGDEIFTKFRGTNTPIGVFLRVQKSTISKSSPQSLLTPTRVVPRRAVSLTLSLTIC